MYVFHAAEKRESVFQWHLLVNIYKNKAGVHTEQSSWMWSGNKGE